MEPPLPESIVPKSNLPRHHLLSDPNCPIRISKGWFVYYVFKLHVSPTCGRAHISAQLLIPGPQVTPMVELCLSLLL